MNLQRKRIIPLAGTLTPTQEFAAAIVASAPVVWLRLRETTGTLADNSGSGGDTLDGTIGGTTTLGQTGLLGVYEAFLYDGLTSFIDIPNDALLSPTVYTELMIFNASSAGEGTAGRLSDFNTSKDYFQLSTISLGNAALFGEVATDLINASISVIAANGVTIDAWTALFKNFDNAGDRKIYLYRASGGVATAITLGAQVAATGTIVAKVGALCVGNRAARDRTLAGLYDEYIRWGRILSGAEMNAIAAVLPT